MIPKQGRKKNISNRQQHGIERVDIKHTVISQQGEEGTENFKKTAWNRAGRHQTCYDFTTRGRHTIQIETKIKLAMLQQGEAYQDNFK